MPKFAAVPFVLLTIVCWGIYGPILHKGQNGLGNNRLAAFLCVGIAYFLIAVIAPIVLMVSSGQKPEWSFGGIFWSLFAGTAGAVGALGIILAFNLQASPAWVMSLVFGCAPVVSAFTTMYLAKITEKPSPWFLAGLIIVGVGAFMTSFFAPRPTAAQKASAPAPPAVEAPKKP